MEFEKSLRPMAAYMSAVKNLRGGTAENFEGGSP